MRFRDRVTFGGRDLSSESFVDGGLLVQPIHFEAAEWPTDDLAPLEGCPAHDALCEIRGLLVSDAPHVRLRISHVVTRYFGSADLG